MPEKLAVPLGALNAVFIVLMVASRGVSMGALLVAAPWLLAVLYCLVHRARWLQVVAICSNLLVAFTLAAAIWMMGITPDDMTGFNLHTLFALGVTALTAIGNPLGLWLIKPAKAPSAHGDTGAIAS